MFCYTDRHGIYLHNYSPQCRRQWWIFTSTLANNCWLFVNLKVLDSWDKERPAKLPLSSVDSGSGAVCMKYSSAAYRFALTRCNPPPHRKTVSIKPFKMATDGPTGRELPAWGWTGLPDPVLSTLDVDKGAVGMVDWRKCARRVKITPDTGDVSSGRAFSSAIWVNQWKCFKFISIRYWLRNRHLAKR